MKPIKRSAALCLAAVLCLSLLAGCGSQQKTVGMDLTVCLGGTPETLDPIRATSEEDETILIHLYENLMRVAGSASGGTTVTNGIAKRYDVEENYNGTVTYTFHLRSAKWSDGVAVTADDFVYAWQRLADPATKSPNAALLSIVEGYDKVRSTGDVTQLQVTAKNDSTLEVTLTSQCGWFLTDVCTAAATVPLRKDVVQKLKAEALDANEQAAANGGQGTATWSSDPTKLVTDGPYTVSSYHADEALQLTASETWTGGTGGPGTICFQFAKTAEEAWDLYESKKVDFVSPLPEEELQSIAKNKNWSPVTELNTYTLLFNTAADPFSDPKLRQAFSLAIDRSALSQAVSVSAKPATGLVPYGVPESEKEDFRTVGGDLLNSDSKEYETCCVQARMLLDQAGYTSGYSFSSVKFLYVDEGDHAAVAEQLIKMWSDVLHVHVKAVGVTAEKFQSALESGEYDLAATDLKGYADDAESFLTDWVSSSENNVVGYRNSAYDTLLAVINNASDETARLGCLHDAESLLLQDGPLMPLYFTGTAWELRSGLTGLCRDARGFFSFTAVTKATT